MRRRRNDSPARPRPDPKRARTVPESSSTQSVSSVATNAVSVVASVETNTESNPGNMNESSIDRLATLMASFVENSMRSQNQGYANFNQIQFQNQETLLW